MTGKACGARTSSSLLAEEDDQDSIQKESVQLANIVNNNTPRFLSSMTTSTEAPSSCDYILRQRKTGVTKSQ